MILYFEVIVVPFVLYWTLIQTSGVIIRVNTGNRNLVRQIMDNVDCTLAALPRDMLL